MLLLSFAAILLPIGASAVQVVRREYSIKAGVLGMLGKCVTWPQEIAPARGEPLRIGILGKDPFEENGVNQLDRIIADEKAKGIHIVALRFASARDYQPCHVLFVSSLAADANAKETITERFKVAEGLTGGKHVLIVGESAGLAQQGAAANLLFDRSTNLIRLEINPDAAARAGLKLTPDLLRLKQVQIVRGS